MAAPNKRDIGFPKRDWVTMVLEAIGFKVGGEIHLLLKSTPVADGVGVKLLPDGLNILVWQKREMLFSEGIECNTTLIGIGAARRGSVRACILPVAHNGVERFSIV